MIRWLVVFAVVFTGCVMTLPSDDGIAADLACETAREMVRLRQVMPPSPAPVTDACDRCGGTGVIGDGASIRMTCPACGGTGKKPKSVLVKPATCTDGSCTR